MNKQLKVISKLQKCMFRLRCESPTARFFESFQVYVRDIPWLLFDRKSYWHDALDCGRLYCSHCGGKLFNYKNYE